MHLLKEVCLKLLIHKSGLENIARVTLRANFGEIWERGKLGDKFARRLPDYFWIFINNRKRVCLHSGAHIKFEYFLLASIRMV